MSAVVSEPVHVDAADSSSCDLLDGKEFERALVHLPSATFVPATTWTSGSPPHCSCGKPPSGNGKTCAGKHPALVHWRTIEAGTRDRGDGHGVVFLTGLRSGFFVVDADSDEAARWLLSLGMPPTFTVRSAKGWHFYFALPDFPVQTSSKKLHPFVDVRGEGGVIVAPGSPHPSGGRYVVANAVDLADANELLLALVRYERKNIQSAEDAPAYQTKPEERIARAVKFLNRESPCVPGMAGGASTHAMRVIAKATRFHGLTSPEMIEAALERSTWNARCVDGSGNPYPWDGHELAHKIDQALHCSVIPWNDPTDYAAKMRGHVHPKPSDGAALIVELKERTSAIVEKATILIDADLHEAVDQGCAALARHPDIYQRQGRLIQPLRIVGRVDWARGESASGVPILREIPSATLTCFLTRVAVWEKYDGRSKRNVQVIPGVRIESAIAKAGNWPGVRTLERIVETPLMRGDGSILQEPGYDAATSVIYEPGAVFPRVPDAPSLEDAKNALADLLEPFEEFPFETDADRLVPAAIVLTALGMGALDGANFPCFLLDANVQGTGKTLCADVVSWILTGRPVPKQTFPANDKNELEKILGSAALAATPMLCLDNVNGTFGGDALEQRMTCRGTSQFRILGKSESPTLPWRTIVVTSGNNVRTTVDMRRRIVRCRLISKVENPEERPIQRTNLRAWVLDHRPRFVVAGLTVLRAFYAAGKPKQSLKPMGNFEEWSELVAGALKWVSGVDVLDARMPEAMAVDPTTQAYAAFLASVPIENLGKSFASAEIARRSCWDELMSDAQPGARATRVGLLLAKMDQRPIDGRQVVREQDAGSKNYRYRVVLVT